ncbi:MAG: helix-turn-helix transcriptional regulator [Clostridia bacterium]|nr:helix-turn-helix transcriptional regulator [Clostridia bacterium]
MTKNSIGQFIAALRKANGMTQQDVADRLNVSNKAVSRWERDECAPDLSLIPAIAEMFGVSCDELLRGERLTNPTASEKIVQKTDKQIKTLIARTLSTMKTLIMVSIGVAAAGVIFMFGISYGFYRPRIGCAVMLLFELAALLITSIAISRAKDVRRSELFENAGEAIRDEFDNTLGNWAFGTVFGVVASLLLALPLVLVDTDFLNGVLSLESYFTLFFGFIVLLLAVIWITCRKPCAVFFATGKLPPREKVKTSAGLLTLVQMCLLLCATLVFLFGQYLQKPERDGFSLFSAVVIFALLCLAANIAVVPVFVWRSKSHKRELLFYGVRNIILTLPVLLLERAHYVSWTHTYFVGIRNDTQELRYYANDHWNIEYIWLAAALAVSVLMVFALIKRVKKK